ncbi:MAG: hypothetical protein Q7T70_00830 [Polaromonas sp.]|nr:hypothetical protein [Polaromonas sp.]
MPSPTAPTQHHLVLPFAASTDGDWLSAARAIPPAALRHLNPLLQGMKQIHADTGDERSLSTPHERVLARALGISDADGLIPWAAWQQNQSLPAAGQAWAFVTPCHWAMGREHATLTDPAALDLQESESRTLLAAMQPYFATEGITLHYEQPTRWLAEGEVFRSLPSASLDRVLSRNVDPWLPADGKIRLLQNEMQMLLYTHTVNDARTSRRLQGVNSFWISGSGALPENPDATPPANMSTPRSLAQAAFSNDWPAWTAAWQALDASEGARLLALQRSGEPVRLSLCGERNALTFETAPRGLWSKVTSLFGPQPLPAVLEQL